MPSSALILQQRHRHCPPVAVDRQKQAKTNSHLALGARLKSAGATLASEGAQIRAAQDLAVQAQTIVLDAAYDTQQSSSSANTVSKTQPKQHSEQSESTTASGSILQAGHPNLKSADWGRWKSLHR
jgi:hypothetical protein